MSRLGKLDEYDPKVQNFESYVERFEHYVTANDIAAEKRLPVFLTAIGAEAYEVVKNLVVPALPGEKTYEEIKVLLKNHYCPKTSVIAERCKFNRRVQLEQESVEDFIVELKHLARKCNFGEFLRDALRDRLVAGIRSEDTQRALFAEEALTFDSACKIALDRELAARQTAAIQEGTRSGSINAMKTSERPVTKTTSSTRQEGKKQKCFRCGKAHAAENCWYKTYACKKCSKVGHLQNMCRASKEELKAHRVSESSEDDENTLYNCTVNSVAKKGYIVTMNVEGQDLPMQVDTGAAVTIVPESVYKAKLSHVKCEPSVIVLKTYTGQKMHVVGECTVNARYEGQTAVLPIVVVREGERKLPVLLGRTWLEKLQLNWGSILFLSTDDRIANLRAKFPSVFSRTLGAIRNFEANIVLKPGSSPVFCKARPLPFALREQTEKRLSDLEGQGIVTRVSRSDWATPLVVVPKKEGDELRLCGDYKVTVNPVLKTDHYPLPQPEELFTALAEGKVFCALDLSSAYQQVLLSPEARQILTINTHKGLYQYNRLPYGIASAPAIFQSLMDKVLLGIANVGCYLDDVIIAGRDVDDCQRTLERVLEKLSEYNLTLKFEKCKFFQSSLVYLGHKISADGIYPTDEKVKAITHAPEPTNTTELKAYLGLLNFYGKFLKNMSSVAEPMYRLLRKGERWLWTKECSNAFSATKQLLINSRALIFYDARKPLGLQCDASAYGVGAVIFHVLPNGDERPIAFASRTLTTAEKKLRAV